MNKWVVIPVKDGSAVHVYFNGKFVERVQSGDDSFRNDDADKFAKRLLNELHEQGLKLEDD